MNQLNIDIDKISAELQITKDIYLRILQKGIAQTQIDIPNLLKAIEENNAEEIKQIAHRLKGDFYNMRIDPLSTLAKQIEDIAKTTMDKAVMLTLLDDFKNIFKKLTQDTTT